VRASGARRVAVAAVGLLTAVPIAVGFIVSWGALRDAALAAHTAPGAARLYPVGVDGLIAVALVAALVLRHNPQASRYCLGVLAAFTLSSLVLNIAHGQGAIIPGRPLAWQLGALVSAQAVAAIGFGCHLLVHVLRAWFPALGVPGPARGSQGSTGQGSARSGGSRQDEASIGEGAAVLRLTRVDGDRRPAPDAAPGSKTAAIRHYRARVLATEAREPTGKEAAAATAASERMARKVLAELRGTETGPDDLDTGPTGTERADAERVGAERVGAGIGEPAREEVG
jgi:hypothetical protein